MELVQEYTMFVCLFVYHACPKGKQVSRPVSTHYDQPDLMASRNDMQCCAHSLGQTYDCLRHMFVSRSVIGQFGLFGFPSPADAKRMKIAIESEH